MNTWTQRDIDILEALTHKVRVLTTEHIVLGWWQGMEQARGEVERLMKRFDQLGLVERLQVFAHPYVDFLPPQYTWRPGDPDPSDEQIEALANFFQGRWNQPEIKFEVYVATRRTANIMGSYAKDPPEDAQWTHDLHVGMLYARMKRDIEKGKFVLPGGTTQIVGEGALPKLGKQINHMKDPDLFWVDERGQATWVHEFAGGYDRKHLHELHTHFCGGAYKKLCERFPDRQQRLYTGPVPYCLY